MEISYQFQIFADYFQFVLMDEESDDDFSEIWTDEAFQRMLAVGRKAVCPGTLRNVDVLVEVNIKDSEPSIDLSKYEHAAEACLEISSGKLVVMNCTGDLSNAPRIALEPGIYRVLFLVSGIETINTEWEPANDKYEIYLWRSNKVNPNLLKDWRLNNA